MAQRDLIGRPLVPFFDADENVNTALTVDPRAANRREHIDVDARVWDKTLGYFVYPTEAPPQQQQHQQQQHHQASDPVAIPRATSAAVAAATATSAQSNAGGRLLLTPDMLSRSAPDAAMMPSSMAQRHQDATEPATAEANGRRTPRSSSAKRASRQRNGGSRSTTPKPAQASPPSADEGANSGGGSGGSSSDRSREKKKKSPARSGEYRASDVPAAPNSGKKGRPKGGGTKSKEELSAAGKWAWSEFQSSPDPKSLPLPPFVAGAGGASAK